MNPSSLPIDFKAMQAGNTISAINAFSAVFGVALALLGSSSWVLISESFSCDMTASMGRTSRVLIYMHNHCIYRCSMYVFRLHLHICFSKWMWQYPTVSLHSWIYLFLSPIRFTFIRRIGFHGWQVDQVFRGWLAGLRLSGMFTSRLTAPRWVNSYAEKSTRYQPTSTLEIYVCKDRCIMLFSYVFYVYFFHSQTWFCNL